MASILGEPVWARFADYGRVLLPMTTLTILALASRQTGEETGHAAVSTAAVAVSA